ncbi:MAG TPA: class I SAM-dependent methyltransferase [Candidatus Bathyarchaeia archaeon]|nr:class I SAM-dependent methyltransferase [Candidatus Bathyarchaeia archaeon]
MQAKDIHTTKGTSGSILYGESEDQMLDKKIYYQNLWRRQRILEPSRGRLLTFKEYVRLISSFSKPSSLILDAGCGSGVIAGTLASSGYNNLVGIDLVNRFKREKGISFVVADNTCLPFRPESFDTIFARKFVSVQDMTRGLGEFHKSLKDDGKLLVEVPNVKRLKSRIYESLGLTPKYPHKYFPHMHMMLFTTILQKCNYIVMKVKGDYVFIPLVASLVSALKLDRLERELGRLVPSLCLHLFAICRKRI